MARVRLEKVQEEIKRTVGSILSTEIYDTKLGFLTVSKVKCSADLRYAKIYISIYDESDESKQEKLLLLKKKKGVVRGLLGNSVRFRHVPELEFYLDDSLDYAEKIDKLIDQVHQEEKDRSHQ
ncbi:MAG: 30S ribosome-binding factor RbfA [Candidatus Marinimicrobia bacterium]|nr:30S ribosome-binding factor RbfA [Candidatus Neomarinimicrobiota bacterium]